MANGERKKGRENKKPKQSGAKQGGKSDYAMRQSEAVTSPISFKPKKK